MFRNIYSLLFANFLLPLMVLSNEEEILIDMTDEEYKRRLALITTSLPYIEQDASIQFPYPLPAIQLCKHKPADDDYYGHIFCWSMVVLFGMTIFSLITYQLRSIFWLKLHASKRRDGWQSNHNNFEEQPDNKQKIQGLLPMRSLA